MPKPKTLLLTMTKTKKDKHKAPFHLRRRPRFIFRLMSIGRLWAWLAEVHDILDVPSQVQAPFDLLSPHLFTPPVIPVQNQQPSLQPTSRIPHTHRITSHPILIALRIVIILYPTPTAILWPDS